MTLAELKDIAIQRNATIKHRTDGNYRIVYENGGVTYVSGVNCYVCDKPCLQAWTTWKQKRTATCSRQCMDRGMYHDKQHLHDGKWWDKYSNHKGYMSRRRKDPITGKVVRSRRHQDNFEKHYGRKQKKGYHLHHINMCKTDDDVSNLAEVTPNKHQELHSTYDKLCKQLMNMDIIRFDADKGYYLVNNKEM